MSEHEMTKKHYSALRLLQDEYKVGINSGDDDYEIYVQLMQNGYAKQLCAISVDWVYLITEKGEACLEAIAP